MKKIIFITMFVVGDLLANTQQQKTIDKLRYNLTATPNDNAKGAILDSLALYYLFFTNKPDSSYYYINKSINWAFNLKDKRFLILAYERMGFYYVCTSQLKAAIEISLKGIKLSENNHIEDYLASLYYNLAWVYANLNDIGFQLNYGHKATHYLKGSKDLFMDQYIHVYGILSAGYIFSNKPDSAFYFLDQMRSRLGYSKELIANDIYQWYLGMYYLRTKQFARADSVLAEGLAECEAINDLQLLQVFYATLAQSYMTQGKIKDAIPLLHRELYFSASTSDREDIKDAARNLYGCFNLLNLHDSAFYYLKLTDSLQMVTDRTSNNNEVRQIAFDIQLNQKEDEANLALQNIRDRNKITAYVFLIAIAFFVILAIIQWRNNRQKKMANLLLQQQKEKVESTLTELKDTQSQLIQSEKMASLGELTAGIAHEIQNPLNFVNNFSDVNKELIEELRMKNEKLKINDEEINDLLDDIAVNEEKINHHGKRADAIVKGMLQHSKTSSSQKEITDINVLADQYLRLAYHGLRAKDKSFNAEPKTDFDSSVGKINIVPQDIGRVLLNLVNNAFYAVNEKKKSCELSAISYEPLVAVLTRKLHGKIEIVVKDNGNGIPKNIVDKIFQPFFTTKPTGQGTGLGLSLAYDIVKAHGGEIKVQSKEGEGSEFVVELPI